jgi:pilus assembly protein CpaD
VNGPVGKDLKMRTKVALLLLASMTGACTYPKTDLADRGVESVNQPVLARETFVFDAAAPAGVLSPEEVGRLDGWFRSLDLGYGDSIYVDGAYAEGVRAQVGQLAGRYGMVVLPAAPVTAGAIAPGSVRVVVSRTRAEVPNCPNWSRPAQPNYHNRSMSNFGCAVNSNLAAMVANPEDLFHGQEVGATTDTITATKAVELYRSTAPSGSKGLQDVSTKQQGQ